MKNASVSICKYALVLAALSSCRAYFRGDEASELAADWADAEVVLTQAEEPYQLILAAPGPVNEFDRRKTFELFASKVSQGLSGDRRSVFYADWEDKSRQRTQSYTYKLQVSPNRSQSEAEVILLLNKTPVSKAYNPRRDSNPKKIYIGRATLKNGLGVLSPSSSKPFTLSQVNGRNSFPGDGGIAIHFIDNPHYEPIPLTNKCTMDDSKGCSLLPLETLCSGSILTPACRPPNLDAQDAATFEKRGEVKGASKLGAATYLLKSGRRSPGAAEVLFVAEQAGATTDDNQTKCLNSVSVLAFTAHDGRQNPACKVRLEPSIEPKDSKLACRFTISFDRPDDVADFGCNITAIFTADGKELQTVQLLYEKDQPGP